MTICQSKEKRGIVGLVGHVGVGHVHSHNGFVQDDSAGFAVVTDILRQAYSVDLKIVQIKADLKSGEILVRTADGGVGLAFARRGVTPIEEELMQRIVGSDAVCTQTLAMQALGRIYGQGVLEVPCALQAAIALACVDTFVRKHSNSFRIVSEDIPSQIGKILGGVVEIDGVAVSVLAVVNATFGGVGPVEDLEGNVCLGNKGRLMQELGLLHMPTIVVESKAYVPAVCSDLLEDSFWFRINKEYDNETVYACLCEAATELGYPFLSSDTAYPRIKDGLGCSTREIAQQIIALGKELELAQTSKEKVGIVSKLALLVSQDCGGVTFMSNALHEIVSGGGTILGTTAVISMLVCQENIDFWKIPVLTRSDLERYKKIICLALFLLAQKKEKASLEVQKKYSFDADKFQFLFQEKR